MSNNIWNLQVLVESDDVRHDIKREDIHKVYPMLPQSHCHDNCWSDHARKVQERLLYMKKRDAYAYETNKPCGFKPKSMVSLSFRDKLKFYMEDKRFWSHKNKKNQT